MSLKNKLKRLKPHLQAGEGRSGDTVVQQQVTNPDHIPYIEIWRNENVEPYYFDGNYCLVRKVEWPITHQHGQYSFSDVIKAVEGWNETDITHPLSSLGHKPEDLFFFDTETTGLGGGVGNTIFLLGHASIQGDSIILTQHILPQPGAEVALYKNFLESIDYTTLVSYNGKAFDWPQVKTRHTLIREHVPKLPSFGHFDLYHAARRMWKHKIERMKLTVVEKEILDFERDDDIPGYLAPMIYYDFLERKHPEGLLRVIKHNELDILSLITLYTHLSFQILGLDKKRTVRETYEVGRWFAHLGDREKATENFEYIARGKEMDAVLAKQALALEYKRKQDWLNAIPLWEDCSKLGNEEISIDASVELAKYYEHKIRNYQLALKYCKLAEGILQSIGIAGKLKKRAEDLAIRSARITKKIKKLKDS
ncbi:ribonuclease H-like domain-containing protein [Bacillus sp. B15-48]|uniref:ribonuclease H-like domain-containing protein n=1 Tax=Bacillus sp. B15-48 TaxID=1548601 RepID=UPI00193EEA86|nr:ribonuclease H-like domain-containing protein [Bacillus sp. B15-48]MBM4762078.1 hypothetical protein [Bacillus sp. B15-48]